MKEKGYKKNETCEGVKIFLKVILKKNEKANIISCCLNYITVYLPSCYDTLCRSVLKKQPLHFHLFLFVMQENSNKYMKITTLAKIKVLS